MRVTVDGKLPEGVTAKDIILAIIGEIGTAGGTGHVIEYCGRGHPRAVDGRPHDRVQHVDRGRRPRRHGGARREDLRLPQGPPEGAQGRGLGQAMRYWETLQVGRGRALRPRGEARRRQAAADRHLGHQPGGRGLHRGRWCPIPAKVADEDKRATMQRALDYMGLKPGTKMTDIPLDVVWIGSCTNGRIEDLRDVAKRRQGQEGLEPARLRHDRAGLGPGEGAGRGRRARQDLQGRGLRMARGRLLHVPRHEPRPAQAAQRCASTSNRNFEGRQGYLGRTHLVSPLMAAAAAIAGHFVDVRKIG